MCEPPAALSVPPSTVMDVTGLFQPKPEPSPLVRFTAAPGLIKSEPPMMEFPELPPASSSVPPVTVVPPV